MAIKYSILDLATIVKGDDINTTLKNLLSLHSLQRN